MAIASAACGARSDFAYEDRTAPFTLSEPELRVPPDVAHAKYEAMWAVDANETWVGGRNDGYAPLLMQSLDGKTWNGFFFDAHFGFEAATRMWGAAQDASWATAGTTLLRWDGTAWLDAVDTKSTLLDVNGSSRDDVWAVGDGIVLHRSGKGWNASKPVSDATHWTGVAADGAGGAWLVAPDVVAHGIEDGFESTPSPVVLVSPSVAAIGPSEAWVVGNDASRRAFVEHRVPGRWTRVALPIDAFASISRVFSVARDDVWIVGDALLHWSGDGLHEALCLDGQGATAHVVGRDVVATSADLWVLGRCGAGPEGVLHWRR